MATNNKRKTGYCKDCDTRVKVIHKMFGVELCPKCNRILASDYPISKGWS